MQGVMARREDRWDDELHVRAARGDEAAFEEIVRLNWRKVWLVCRQYLRDDHEAENAAQEVFLKAWRSLRRFDGRSALSTWLYRIAVNTCLDMIRKRSKVPEQQQLPEKDLLRDGAADPERRAMQKEAVKMLASAEEQLPPQQKQVFRLRFYAGLALEEIADTLGISVGTVKTQLHRAVHRVRRQLEVAR